MFRSKRSGLVRRLWRSRLIPARVEEDGCSKGSEGVRGGLCSSNPEKVPKTELRTVARGASLMEEFGVVRERSPPGVGGSGVTLDQDGGVMYDLECRSPQSAEEGDCNTVTCCLFKDRDHSVPRSPSARIRSKTSGSCQMVPGNLTSRDSSSAGGQETKPLSIVEQELQTATYSFLKRLKEKPLDALWEAVESKGGMASDCVMVSRTELRLGGHTAPPHLLLCKLFRWSDLQYTSQLKPLLDCQSFGAVDGLMVCCNPYHYSRLCGPDPAKQARGPPHSTGPQKADPPGACPTARYMLGGESPPPPYSRHSPNEELKPLDRSDSMLSYTETEVTSSPNVTPGSASGELHWVYISHLFTCRGAGYRL
ncbi:hypothetical protein JZ751_020508 [Albula glossodonta]|uniref:MH1 domain-containing protein n=1 Tax=Albula glossodonta TaxID=121402 RepID=A0A8T2PHU6_9TELE|nr:hypothetical protein JZ751_020508 [Albula glossodonta]